MFFSHFEPVLDGFALVQTDGHTNGRTDKPTYRDARTHLKTLSKRKKSAVDWPKSANTTYGWTDVANFPPLFRGCHEFIASCRTEYLCTLLQSESTANNPFMWYDWCALDRRTDKREGITKTVSRCSSPFSARWVYSIFNWSSSSFMCMCCRYMSLTLSWWIAEKLTRWKLSSSWNDN